jgi:hypothetical protein
MGVSGSSPMPSGGAATAGAAGADAGYGGAAGGQPPETEGVVLELHELGSANCKSRVLDVARAPSGDIAIGGNYCDELRLDGGPSLLPAADGFDAFVLVLDARFEPRWAWTIEGDFGETVSALTFLPNGHLVARGSAANRDSFAAQLDANGKEVWSWKALDQYYYTPRSVLFDPELGIVEAGYASEALAGPPWLGPAQLYLGRMDAQGQYLEQSYSVIGDWEDALASQAVVAAPGELVLSGWGKSGDTKTGFVRRMSADATSLFTRLLTSVDAVEAVGVAMTGDGSIVAGGGFRGSLTLGTTTLTAAQPTWSNEWLAKLDGDGNPLWVQSLHSGLFTRLTSLAVDEQGDIVAAGLKEQGLYVRRLSSNGEQRWWRDFHSNVLGNLHVVPDGPQQLLLVGDGANTSFGPGQDSQAENIFLVRFGDAQQ